MGKSHTGHLAWDIHKDESCPHVWTSPQISSPVLPGSPHSASVEWNSCSLSFRLRSFIPIPTQGTVSHHAIDHQTAAGHSWQGMACDLGWPLRRVRRCFVWVSCSPSSSGLFSELNEFLVMILAPLAVYWPCQSGLRSSLQATPPQKMVLPRRLLLPRNLPKSFPSFPPAHSSALSQRHPLATSSVVVTA